MNNKKKQKIGLFGGTFAPPHLGHIHAVRAVFENVNLDEIIVMPTSIPPHKVKAKGDTPELRLAMCRVAFDGISKVTVSDYEIQKGGISYTVDTLEYLTCPEREIYLICGTDMLFSLDRWYRAEQIFRLAKVICIPRDNTDKLILQSKKSEYIEKYSADVTLLTSEPIDISSTEIRRRIEMGEALTEYLPSGVADIIKQEKLYDAKNNT